jgi:hypothetical protein
MQKILLTCGLFFICAFGRAQFYKSIVAPPAGFTDSLQKIVLDFRFDFHTIQDSLLEGGGDYETYASKVTIPGSTDCQIMRFHSVEDTTAAFEATIYQGDNYDDAVKTYKNFIRMLKRGRMKWIDNSFMSFDGTVKEPNPSLNFSITTLTLDIIDPRYKDFYAQVELESNMLNWKVDISFSNKRSDTEGTIN